MHNSQNEIDSLGSLERSSLARCVEVRYVALAAFTVVKKGVEEKWRCTSRNCRFPIGCVLLLKGAGARERRSII
jgi:hypothetical protein